MAGAIAGTAILNAKGLNNSLHTITLTINNNCNLSCPHCYLQYKSSKELLETNTLISILNSDFEHLAIVGKEPLVSNKSIELLEVIVNKVVLSGKTVSIITNGIGLKRLSKDAIKQISYFDISFDGGPNTYALYRKGSFNKVIEGINYIAQNGAKQINALHTISNETLENIEDMVAVKFFANFDKIMFSPYLTTKNHGINSVNQIKLKDILEKLNYSELFHNTKEAFLLLDLYHLTQEGTTNNEVYCQIQMLKLYEKIKFIEKDPLYYGIIRVTYDDFVLTPYQSIHPLEYCKSSILASGSNLNFVYSQFIKEYSKNHD